MAEGGALMSEYKNVMLLPICNPETLEKTNGIRVPHLCIRRRGRKRKMKRFKDAFEVQRKRMRRSKAESSGTAITANI